MKTNKNMVCAALATGLLLSTGAMAESYTCKHQCYMGESQGNVCVSSYQRTEDGFKRKDTGRIYSGVENDRFLSLASPFVEDDLGSVVSLIIDKKSLQFRIATLRTNASNTFDSGSCTWRPKG